MVRSTKKLQCAQCGRMFGMPAHLGRHMNAVHGIGKPARAGRKPARGRGRPAGPTTPDGFGQAESHLQRARESLLQQRATIDSQIEKIGQVLEALS
ncbi:MAG: hypothetical protein KBH81_10675 [Phycisphaerae bacterium]|jgi:uncharacterized C2H2 Zn-finger protein|nr:hypothetical protein [Phycisphaerae bacterium]